MRLVISILVCLLTVGGRAEELTVGWWNIENFGVTDRFIDNRHVSSAMKPESEQLAVAAILHQMNPDILGVAEVLQDPEDRYVKLLRGLLKAHGLDYPYLATAKGADPRIQMVLFSRYPLDEADFMQDTFPATVISKSGATLPTTFRVNRGFLNVTVHVRPGYVLQIMTAHLKSKRPSKEVEGGTTGESGDEYVRRNEALLLKNHMNRFLQDHPGADLLVMGDLNDTFRSRTLRTIRGSMGSEYPVHDLPLADYLGDMWTELFLPEYEYARIDYMFTSDSLYQRFEPDKSYLYRWHQGAPKELDHYQASDHRPLFATFKIEH